MMSDQITETDELSSSEISEDVLTSDSNPILPRKMPKQESEIITLEDIVGDLRYLTQGYPTAAIKAALLKQNEITPILLGFLRYTLENYDHLENYYFGHLHAMFLLAYFQEKAAFPLIMQIAALPEEWPEDILGDTITEDFDRIIVSTYDGNIALIQRLIEDIDVNTWSRNAALRSLLVLVKSNVLERAWVIDYFKQLFHHKTFMDDEDAMTHLVSVSSDLYPEELYDEIKNAFEHDQVDPFHINMKWIDGVLAMGKEEALARFIYDNEKCDFINDVIDSMQWWACFYEDENELENFFDANDEDEIHWLDEQAWQAPIPYHREFTKIGRNESCPCGSGKKYKKCCLS